MVGKAIGALIGLALSWLLGLPVEFVFGFTALTTLAGHFVLDTEGRTKKTRPILREPPVNRPLAAPRVPDVVTPAQQEQIALLCPMFIEFARVDGPVSQPEVRVIREYFERERFGETALEAVRVALKDCIAAPARELAELARACRGVVSPPQRPELLKVIYDLALIDGDMRRSESDALRVIVQQFNLSEEQQQRITREFFGSGEEHYRLLGLAETATDDEIRSAFRRLAAENHPDRAASLGPKEAEAAAERFRAVKDAFDALKKLRGL